MKKLVLFLAVATAVAFASCGNKEAKQETPVAEEPAVEVVEEVEALGTEDHLHGALAVVLVVEGPQGVHRGYVLCCGAERQAR